MVRAILSNFTFIRNSGYEVVTTKTNNFVKSTLWDKGIMNKFLIGSGGKTATQRLKGKASEQYVLEFASPCMFRVVEKVD